MVKIHLSDRAGTSKPHGRTIWDVPGQPAGPRDVVTNERLRSRLAERRLTPADLARLVQVDPKTVERWISASERTPQRSHRWKVAAELGVDEAYLWPRAIDERRSNLLSNAELVQLYPNRGAVPGELWPAMVRKATESIDVLVYAGLFLFDTYPDLLADLTERAASGTRVRLTLGDPDSAAVEHRGDEEGIDMAGRARMALGIVARLIDVPGIEIRVHGTTLYTSLFRADSLVLANVHTYGSAAVHAPVLHLQRVAGGRLVEHYLQAYERVWEMATPYGEDGPS